LIIKLIAKQNIKQLICKFTNLPATYTVNNNVNSHFHSAVHARLLHQLPNNYYAFFADHEGSRLKSERHWCRQGISLAYVKFGILYHNGEGVNWCTCRKIINDSLCKLSRLL